MVLLLLLLAAPAVGCRPETVVAGDEVVRDGEEVFSELALRVWGSAAVTLAENHELDASLRKEPLHELEGKAAQAVAVGNHNCRDRAAMDEFQKPLEAGPVPIEAGPDVSDDEVGVGPLLLEVGGLALEVAALVVGRDAGVSRRRVCALLRPPLEPRLQGPERWRQCRRRCSGGCLRRCGRTQPCPAGASDGALCMRHDSAGGFRGSIGTCSPPQETPFPRTGKFVCSARRSTWDTVAATIARSE